jgi:hypothetical protein
VAVVESLRAKFEVRRLVHIGPDAGDAHRFPVLVGDRRICLDRHQHRDLGTPRTSEDIVGHSIKYAQLAACR